jgi:hypothetical protein
MRAARLILLNSLVLKASAFLYNLYKLRDAALYWFSSYKPHYHKTSFIEAVMNEMLLTMG